MQVEEPVPAIQAFFCPDSAGGKSSGEKTVEDLLGVSIRCPFPELYANICI